MDETTNKSNEVGNQQEHLLHQGSETPVYTSDVATKATTPPQPTATPIQNTNYRQGNTTNSQTNYTTSTQSVESGFDTTPMEMKDWVLTILAAFIPCCGNLIIYCIWAFGKTGNLNRRNFCRAGLILIGIVYLIFFLIYGSLFISSMSMLGTMRDFY